MIHDVAIIGAGLSGLSAARYLAGKGLDVVIVEKSRGVGGRAATRRIPLSDGAVMLVDHGAQFFTARDPLFQAQVSAWLSRGVCFEWATGFHTWDGVSLKLPDHNGEAPRFACHEGMSALGKDLATGLQVIRNFPVTSVSLEPEGWVLHSDAPASVDPVRARTLFCSAPAPQSLKLIGAHLSKDERQLLEGITFGSCLALVVLLNNLPDDLGWKGIQIRDSQSPLTWIACDSTRRGAGQSHGSIVVHASPAFSSDENISTPEGKEKASAEILREAAGIVGAWLGSSASTVSHLWRYAIPLGGGVPDGFLRPASQAPLYVIGDGLQGGRVEGAWLSGLRAAGDYLKNSGLDFPQGS